ncbi:MAG: heavy-metal-associated domain-containing protein [Flavobacteriaceae bacterium]|nr:heavy-metal-associated domain-containing protein [Flavobacteriaceae bacterium]
MNSTYKIKGMHSVGCTKLILKTLSAIPGVTNVQVNEDAKEINIHMNSIIRLETFQQALKKQNDTYCILHPQVYKNDY